MTVTGERMRAVTLDATGTLIHCPRLGEIYGEVLRRHGLVVEAERARELVHVVWRELDVAVRGDTDRFAAHPGGARGFWRRFLERFSEHLGAPPPSRFAAAELFDRFGRAAAWEVYPDVAPALAELRRAGLALAVVANWDERLPALLGELGLAESLAAIVTSQEAGVQKPHPDIFRTALDRLGVPPSQALHVGDRRLEDVEGAEAIGMRAVLLTRGGGSGLRDLSELPEALHRLPPTC